MSELIDLHAHVLPGVDDGPPDLEAALALARTMTELGVGRVVATSHVSTRYPNRPETLAPAREALAEALASHGIPLAVEKGAEVTLEQAAQLPDDVLAALTLGSGPYVLLESPLSPAAADVDRGVEAVLERGHRVVLAHPERSPAFQQAPHTLERLVAEGVLCAVTAGAFAGRFGRTAKAFVQRMTVDGLVHVVTSDAHDLAGRRPGIEDELRAAGRELAGLDALVPWLTREAPAAILRGDPVGMPPGMVDHAAAPPRRGWRRLLGR
jgi:protein-tyrosine phosphatase